MKQNLIILAEGADGSGKTTTLKILQQILENKQGQAVYIKGLGGPKFIDQLAKRFWWTPLFFLENFYTTVTQIIPAQRQGKIILLDRYVISCIVSASPGIFSKLLSKLAMRFSVKPDIFLYFTASHQEQLKRIAQRIKPNHLNLLKNPDRLVKIDADTQSHYHRFNGHKLAIDTTNSKPQEIAEQIKKLVLNLKL